MLGAAVKAWEKKGSSTRRHDGRPLSLAAFTKIKGLNPNTFQKYAYKD